MKKFILVIISIFLPVSMAHAYVIDGNLGDWNVLLNAASQTQGYLNTHLPSGGHDIDVITEDNADQNSGTIFVGPGYSIGNRYDAEAIYMDNDLNNLYIAIVTGTPPNEADFPPGDIFIDTGKFQNPSSSFFDTSKFGFGIDIATSQLYTVNSWQDVLYPQHSASNPWKIGSNKILLGNVNFVYSGDQNSHYVLEAQVPLSLLGLSANPNDPNQDAWIHWTMQCGNDSLTLKGDVNPVIPEPSSLFLMGSGLVAALGRIRKKFSKV